jgi:hypothetical protein
MKTFRKRRQFLAGSLVAAAGAAMAHSSLSVPVGLAHLRVARATGDLAAVLGFYRDGLRPDVIYECRDHAGFDGVMLGFPGSPYHLDFTKPAAHRAGGAPGPENLLVFFPPLASG